MKNLYQQWLKFKEYHSLIVFIMIQTGIFFFFTIMFFRVRNHYELYDYYDKLYICSIICLFLAFMYHFAFHSIKYAYIFELIAFLIMSILSSVIISYVFIVYVIIKDEEKKVSIFLK